MAISVDDRAVRKMLGQYQPKEMNRRLRAGTRAGVRPYRAGLRSAARSRSDIPDSFAKTRTRHSASLRSIAGGGVFSSVRPSSPLLSIFEAGASGHDIKPTSRTFLLAGPAGVRGRKRDMRARGTVRHPGMSARPILAPVFQSVTPAARRVVATTVFGDRAVGLLGLGGDE